MLDRLLEMIKSQCDLLEMRSVLVEAANQGMDKGRDTLKTPTKT